MAKFITAREAASLIPDGATIGLAGMGLSGWAEEVGCAIRDCFRETGHPRDLNLKQGSAMGDWHERGATRLGEAGEGCVTRWSGARMWAPPLRCGIWRLPISSSVIACRRA